MRTSLMRWMMQSPLICLLIPLAWSLLGVEECQSDADGDGFSPGQSDCDDANPDIHPDAAELCNGLDDDCDGKIDENFGLQSFYRDVDGDGYGIPGSSIEACAAPPGYVSNVDDCDDTDASISPGSSETCDERDNDCDAAVDEGVLLTYYPDGDGDGFGVSSASGVGCVVPDGYVQSGADCDDTNSAVFPGQKEVCNAVDDNCNAFSDEGVTLTFYRDSDGDGFGQSEDAVTGCVAPEGFAVVPGDCDDSLPSVHPGELEVCDGRDNNCDTVADEGFPNLNWWFDSDGDGFGIGAPVKAACSPGERYTTSRGDCDDANPMAYPAATDPTGDGIDQDCAGRDGAQLHVGLSSTSTTLRSAISGAVANDIVFVGAGTYQEAALSFGGKALTLISTRGPEFTTINAAGQGRIFDIAAKETRNTVIDGFTLTGGSVDRGGAIRISSASPTLRWLVLTGNNSTSDGGAVQISGGNALLEDLLVKENTCSNLGGGINVTNGATATLSQVTLTGNSGRYGGGGIAVRKATLAVTGLTIEDNICTSGMGGGLYLTEAGGTYSEVTLRRNRAPKSYGGGMAIYASSPSIRHILMQENDAIKGAGAYLSSSSPAIEDLTVLDHRPSSGDQGGGGLYLDKSSPVVTQAVFQGNQSSFGGAIYMTQSAPRLSNCLFSHNEAPYGGAVAIDRSSPFLSHLTVTLNRALEAGGGLYITHKESQVELVSSIMAYNLAGDVYNEPQAEGGVSVAFSLLFSWGVSHNLTAFDDTVRGLEPEFVAIAPDASREGLDVHLRPGSPAIDQGDPSEVDPDGSVADMGYFGGAAADFSYYADAEGDGMHDGWEARQGLSSETDDSSWDLDQDGLSNLEEFLFASSPYLADTDQDGFSDSQELQAGTRPDDAFSQPGLEEPLSISVPSDVPSIQEAVNLISRAGRIVLEAGTYSESVAIENRHVSLEGVSGASGTVLSPAAGRAVSAVSAGLDLSGVTVSGGRELRGGGAALAFVEGALHSLAFVDNSAEGGDSYSHGGAIWLLASRPEIQAVSFVGNRAEGSGGALYGLDLGSQVVSCGFEQNAALGQGGAIFLSHSSPALQGVTFIGNMAGTDGGALALSYASPLLEAAGFQGNSAEGNGGAVAAYYGSPTLQDLSVQSNLTRGNGGGIYGENTAYTLLRASLVSNQAEGDGGAYFAQRDADVMENVIARSNRATGSGGAVGLTSGQLALSQSTLVDNLAGRDGGGLLVSGSSTGLSLENTIVAFNHGYNLFVDDAEGDPALDIGYSDFYATGALPNYNLPALEASNLEVDPRFVAFSPDRQLENDDLHLRADSPLVDAGAPLTLDADGSRADLGAYGGAQADRTGMGDSDGDGMSDGWEQAHGLDPYSQDGAADADGDGLSNADELLFSTDPNAFDTDSDGTSDGAEVASGSSPVDWYAQPGSLQGAVAVVPGDFAQIQAAIDAIVTAGTIEVEAGYYAETLEIYSKEVHLVAPYGAPVTVLEGSGQRPLTVLGSRVSLTGFTLTGGHATRGGGAAIDLSTGELEACFLTANEAEEEGGGLVAEDSDLRIKETTVFGNESADLGGGLAVTSSSLALEGSEVSGNLAISGGGISAMDSDLQLVDSRMEANVADEGAGVAAFRGSIVSSGASWVANEATHLGGGLLAEETSLSISDTSLEANSAEESGGAAYLSACTGEVVDASFEANEAGNEGGALYLTGGDTDIGRSSFLANGARVGGAVSVASSASPTFHQAIFVGNRALEEGGAVAVASSELSLRHATLVGNGARRDGGGLFISENGALSADHALFMDNAGGNLITEAGAQVALTFSGLWATFGPNHSLDSLDESNRQERPSFMAFRQDGTFDDDLHLLPASAYVDAGAPDCLDPDGSVCDIGAYGGPDAEKTYALDQDVDGLMDGWEARYHVSSLEPESDGDLDGLTLLEEFYAGTDPTSADTDGDRVLDGDEVSAGSSPLDWYARPDGTAVAGVPGDFSTLQEAVWAVVEEGEIFVASGTFEGKLSLWSRQITLRGVPGESVLMGEGDAVLEALSSSLALMDVSVQGGRADRGAGLYVAHSDLELSDVEVFDNVASGSGGGLYAYQSRLALSGVRVSENDAAEVGGGLAVESSSGDIASSEVIENEAGTRGGGLYLYASPLSLSDIVLERNIAGTRGGGLYAYKSSPIVTGGEVSENQASEGGGFYLYYQSEAELSGLHIARNEADRGAGIYAYYQSDFRLTDSVLEGNLAAVEGGGLYLYASSPGIAGSVIAENEAPDGAGMLVAYLSAPASSNDVWASNIATQGGAISAREGSTPSFTNDTVAWNKAYSMGGGMYVKDGSVIPTVHNTIVAFNAGGDLYSGSSPSSYVLSYSDVYSPYGTSHNLGTLPTGNRQTDPLFVSIEPVSVGTVDGLRLSASSPLIDQGDPEMLDADGSRSDMGAFGGEAGGVGSLGAYLKDTDGDGMSDAWEAMVGLNPNVDEGALDADGDGLTNAEEALAYTDPRLADTDGDGHSDADEIMAGYDARDYYSQPGVDGVAVARVPGDFERVSEALAAIVREGKIALSAGVYRESLSISMKSVTLLGVGATETVLEGQGGRVLEVTSATLNLSFVTVRGGESDQGAGIRFSYGSGLLDQVVVSGNEADKGGGVYLRTSSPIFRHCVLEDNAAARGGGVYLEASSPHFEAVMVKDNRAEYGAGFFFYKGSPVVSQSVVVANQASVSGGGFFLQGVTKPSLSGSIVTHNSSYNIYVDSSDGQPAPVLAYTDVYSPAGGLNHNLSSFPASNFVVEPSFLSYDSSGMPGDVHLSLKSVLINAGDSSGVDADGSRSDLGIFGGAEGDAWDLDGDGVPAYFWPGSYANAPSSVVASEYDCQDLNAALQSCGG